MKLIEIANRAELRPLKIPAREVPHAVVEPNYTCNRRCALCYNRYRDIVKPIEQVTAEVDQLLAKRNLETMSILGGEPTLHPALPEIVRYIKNKKLVCQILTNGLVLYKDDKDLLLNRLVKAGLDRIVIHIDSGQGLDQHGIDAMRDALFAKCEKRRLYFALSMTLYEINHTDIPRVMRRYARYRYFDGMLATVAREEDPDESSAGPPNATIDLHAAYSSVAAGLHIEPASFIPSSLDDNEVRWLIYFYYLNARTGATVSMSPAFQRLVRRLYRFATGRHLFAATMSISLFLLWFFMTAVLEILLHPRQLVEFLRLAKNSNFLREVRFHYIVIQSAPRLTRETKRVEICYHCPDATIRDGKLAPVCLADRMRPPARNGIREPGDTELARAVDMHLEEA